jgi:hypothetical protein
MDVRGADMGAGGTPVSAGGDRDGRGGRTAMSPEPSAKRQESSCEKPGREPPQPTRREPTKRGRQKKTAEDRQHEAAVYAVMAHFEEETQLKRPTPVRVRRSAGQWWHPMVEICETCGWDVADASEIVDDALARLRKAQFIIADPNSILKTARAVMAERKRGAAVRERGGSAWVDKDGVVRMPS